MKLGRIEEIIKKIKDVKPTPISKKTFVALGEIKNKNRRFGTNWAKVWETINKPLK